MFCRLSKQHCKMVLGDNQYYYISLREDQDSICLIMTSDENMIIEDTELEERRELVKYCHETLHKIVNSLSKKPDEICEPTAYVPCPQCDKLHFRLDFVCSAKKRALRCKTKLPFGYYSDLAEKGMVYS